MFSRDLLNQAKGFLALCRDRNLKVCTAESCTGGLVAALLTEIAGSSDVVDRGFVTYSNDAKRQQLGVSKEMLDKFGAVSAEVAGAMAEGALARSLADLAIAVTGIAGPGGGSVSKPIGLVHFACAGRGKPIATDYRIFSGLDRHGVRIAAVKTALDLASVQAEATGLRGSVAGEP